MSNLTQETIDVIEKDASEKTKEKEVEIKDRFYKYSPNKVAYLDGYETGRIDGATEWAGKANPVMDALEQIQNSPTPHTVNEMEWWIETARNLAAAVLAKYKEVTNG